MKDRANSEPSGEPDWIKSYMDITGVTESEARCIFMYVGCKDTAGTGEQNTVANGDAASSVHPGNSSSAQS